MAEKKYLLRGTRRVPRRTVVGELSLGASRVALIIRQREVGAVWMDSLEDCHARKNCVHEGRSDDLPDWGEDVPCRFLRLSRLSLGCIVWGWWLDMDAYLLGGNVFGLSSSRLDLLHLLLFYLHERICLTLKKLNRNLISSYLNYDKSPTSENKFRNGLLRVVTRIQHSISKLTSKQYY